MSDRQLRPRHLLVRPAGRWIGVGRAAVDQPDLFEAEYRAGWWTVSVCRVCLVNLVNTLRGGLRQALAMEGKDG